MSCYIYKISVQDLLDGKQLPGGDIITATIGVGIPGEITFSLADTADNWWKALLLFNSLQSDPISIGEFHQQNVPSASLPQAELQGKYLVLSKATALGVHTNVYWISDAATGFKNGESVTITWN